MKTQDTLIVLLLQAMAGGATRNTFDVYKGLKARNWNVRLIVSSLGVAARYREELDSFEALDIESVPMRRAPHVSDVRAYFKLRQILCGLKMKTILHAHSTKAGMLGHLLHPHVHASILSPHAYRGIDPQLHGPSRELIERVEARYSKTYDRVVAEVPLEYDYAVKIGVAKETLRLIPNGINVADTLLGELQERRRTISANPTLGFVGRLVYQKNPLLFVEVLHEVVRAGCDANAIVLGDGPLKTEMVSLAERYGIAGRISWRGEVSAASVYAEMDLMLHTSFYEAMAYSLIEACGALLPIVATRNPGSEAIMGQYLSENIATQHAAAELSKIVLRILEDNQLRLQQLEIMRKIAIQYSTDTMISRLEDEYMTLLSDPESNRSGRQQETDAA